MSRRKLTLIIIIGIAVLAVFVSLYASGSNGKGPAASLFTQPAVNSANRFMRALKAYDHTTAYELCTLKFKAQLGSPQKLQDKISGDDVVPIGWLVVDKRVSGSRAELEGTVTFERVREGTFSMTLENEKGEWKIAGYDFTEK